MTRSERMRKLWASPDFRKKQAESIKTRRKRGEVKAEREERKRRRMLKQAERESKRSRRRAKRELRNRPLSAVLRPRHDSEYMRPWHTIRTSHVTIINKHGQISRVPMYMEDEI